MDFADFRLPWGGRHTLIVVLGYSRRMWLKFCERQTMPVVMRGLEASIAYFGGVPSELLFDQMRPSSSATSGRGRTVDREPGVPALQPPLALPDPRMPSVPGPDQGEGRAVGPLYPGQLLLRPGVRGRRRPQRADPAVARWRGARSDPRYPEGARGGPVRPREAMLRSDGHDSYSVSFLGENIVRGGRWTTMPDENFYGVSRKTPGGSIQTESAVQRSNFGWRFFPGRALRSGLPGKST